MNRRDFEILRDLPGKVIRGDVRFAQPRSTSPAIVAENLMIENDLGIDLRLTITYNPRVGSKTFNVHVPGMGPICRLDVDGPMHRPAGRSHKHSLQSERCPDRNLPDAVVDRSDLSGRDLTDLFREFCELASVRHDGEFLSPSTKE